jgi:ABC-2 type transport system ATP-binding protein
LKPDGGEGTCLGFNVRTQSGKIKPRVGYMAQRFSLYDDLTVRENLDFMARAYRLPRRKATVAATIERFRLAAFAGQLAGSLSGAGSSAWRRPPAFCTSPSSLLLDEPTAGWTPRPGATSSGTRSTTWPPGRHHRAHLHPLHGTAERCHTRPRLAYIAYGDLLARGTGPELIKESGFVHLCRVRGRTCTRWPRA